MKEQIEIYCNDKDIFVKKARDGAIYKDTRERTGFKDGVVAIFKIRGKSLNRLQSKFKTDSVESVIKKMAELLDVADVYNSSNVNDNVQHLQMIRAKRTETEPKQKPKQKSESFDDNIKTIMALRLAVAKLQKMKTIEDLQKAKQKPKPKAKAKK